jgi:hypothetical protein
MRCQVPAAVDEAVRIRAIAAPGRRRQLDDRLLETADPRDGAVVGDRCEEGPETGLEVGRPQRDQDTAIDRLDCRNREILVALLHRAHGGKLEHERRVRRERPELIAAKCRR